MGFEKLINMIAETPQPPYYAVIFSSIRTKGDKGYSEMGTNCLIQKSKYVFRN